MKNEGDTLWLSEPMRLGGFVTLGIKLTRPDGSVVNDYARMRLPHDVAPGEEAEFVAAFRAPDEPGTYGLVFDMVSERIAWFASCGGRPVSRRLEVA